MRHDTRQVVERIRQSAEGLAVNLKAMPADKAAWKPFDKGRSAFEMVAECGVISRKTAETLCTREDPRMNCTVFRQIQAETDTIEKATQLLQDGTDALVAAIEAFSEEHWEDTVTMPRGQVLTFVEFVQLVYWNNTYHNGQISYIQTLYGDTELYGY